MTSNRAVAILRIFLGLIFLTNGLAKFFPVIGYLPGGLSLINTSSALGIIQHNARHHPVKPYHDLVFNVFVPNWNIVGPMVGLAETVAGLMLVLGVASWMGALLAAGQSLHIEFSDANGYWLFEYAVEWVPLLLLVFMHSGMTWGIDARIAATNSRWRRLFG